MHGRALPSDESEACEPLHEDVGFKTHGPGGSDNRLEYNAKKSMAAGAGLAFSVG
jgi:hypothetical protein